jgi:uncharacterized integral membrane protein
MSSQKTPVISLFLWGLAIAISLAIVFQNLQPLVVIYFLGKSTIPIPLSLAILAAFLIGGLCAFIINQISFWLSPRDKFADRSQAELEDEFDDEFDEPEEYTKSSPPPKPKNSKPSPPQDDTVRYGSSYEDEDFDDDDDVIDIKYVDR